MGMANNVIHDWLFLSIYFFIIYLYTFIYFEFLINEIIYTQSEAHIMEYKCIYSHDSYECTLHSLVFFLYFIFTFHAILCIKSTLQVEK